MEPNNRPQGRKKVVSGESKGTARRGSGLNTGPVGSGSRPQSSAPGPQQPRRATGRAGGGRGLPVGIIVLLFLLLGGSRLFGTDLFGGSDSGVYTNTPSQSSGYSTSSNYGGGTSNSGTSSGGGTSNSGGFSYSDFSGLFSEQSPYSSLNQGSGGSVSAGSSNSSSIDTAVASGARAKRTTIYGNGMDNVTIMVYMCGTDLESRGAMATKDLIEMTNASFGDNVNILVYTGGCTKWNNQVVSADTNQIHQIARSGGKGGIKTLVRDMGRGAMTDPNTLAEFIVWCKEHYPANRNILIFWDHGGGSVSGYGYDQKFPRKGAMNLSGISAALQKGGLSFDFIGFDACLMATTETALMLDPYADYLIASEETEPGIGWYYTNWLTKLGRDTGMSTLEIGKNIVDDFVSACASQCRGQAATLSVVDLAELAYTVPAPMRAFAQSISTQVNSGNYKTVSEARSGSREFARSSVIDQIDLVDFATRVGSREGKTLANAIRGAVKYNRVSSNMSNAYGLSIYFPYRKLNNVSNAIKTFDAIGMDASYAQCIRDFASLQSSGQVAAGGTSSPLDALFGGLGGFSGGYSGSTGGYSGGYSGSSGGYSSGYSGSSGSSAYGDMDLLGTLLGSFLGGDSTGGLYGMSGDDLSFLFGRSMSVEDTVQYLAENHIDDADLVWTENGNGEMVVMLSEDQWSLITELDLNLFYDDGEGYIDLGLDNVFDWDEDNNLLAPTDRTWLAVNGQPVAYYHDTTAGEGDDLSITGHIPVMLNGERAELLVIFDAEHPAGEITGARRVYLDGETQTVAKSITELEKGDLIDFVCDYYRYDGSYENSYFLGEQLKVDGELALSNVEVGDGPVSVTYRFTDIYQQHYWTPALSA